MTEENLCSKFHKGVGKYGKDRIAVQQMKCEWRYEGVKWCNAFEDLHVFVELGRKFTKEEVDTAEAIGMAYNKTE